MIISTAGQPLAVSQFIKACNELIGQSEVLVGGEVANYSVSQGKFVYFDLKDENEEARVACFAMIFNLGTAIEDGMRVVVSARPNIYSKSGKFSLVVSKIEPIGEGSLKRAFELLKARLDKEGLFATARKRRLPRYVRHVGLVSSLDAAGLGDFRRVASGRLKGANYILANVTVQGQNAEKEIVYALDYLNSRYDLDAIIVLRGGGSLEDLHAFNSELVARAISRSKAPVMTGIGHERDVTIADYCADLRAATPTNAAQLLLPEVDEVRNYVFRLTQQGQRLVEKLSQSKRDRCIGILKTLEKYLENMISQKRTNCQALLRSIDNLSPQSTLSRGYALVWDSQGRLIRGIDQAQAGNLIAVRLVDGQFDASISEIKL